MAMLFLQAKVAISTVIDAVSRLFTVRMKLGEFDPPDNNPYTKCVAACYCTRVSMSCTKYLSTSVG